MRRDCAWSAMALALRTSAARSTSTQARGSASRLDCVGIGALKITGPQNAMQDKATLEDALAIMRDLRARDAWDRAQTHDSLRPYLNEEMHELDDALREGDDAAMCSELGDVLLQVLFHAVIAEERGAFGPEHVAGSLVAKMRRRHPWLYG